MPKESNPIKDRAFQRTLKNLLTSLRRAFLSLLIHLVQPLDELAQRNPPPTDDKEAGCAFG